MGGGLNSTRRRESAEKKAGESGFPESKQLRFSEVFSAFSSASPRLRVEGRFLAWSSLRFLCDLCVSALKSLLPANGESSCIS